MRHLFTRVRVRVRVRVRGVMKRKWLGRERFLCSGKDLTLSGSELSAWGIEVSVLSAGDGEVSAPMGRSKPISSK